MIQFAKMDENAVLPVRSNPFDAGMDLSSCENVVVPSHGQAIVDTGIAVSFPTDCYARVAPRSGLAAKRSIDVFAGVVDCGYTNRIKVILYNHGAEDFVVSVGDRIAQLIFERIYIPTFSEVSEIPYEQLVQDVTAKLADVEQGTSGIRGLSGFGSTGV